MLSFYSNYDVEYGSLTDIDRKLCNYYLLIMFHAATTSYSKQWSCPMKQRSMHLYKILTVGYCVVHW